MTAETRERLAAFAREHMGEKRFRHTEGVAAEALRLGSIYLPDELDALETAAWLHDISKDLDHNAQLQYCTRFDIILDKYQKRAPGVLHAITGADTAERALPDLVDRNVKSAIRYHTTGRENMTVFESVIYLADYIEPGRRHESCRELRRYFYRDAGKKDKREHLADTMIMSFDMTVRYLTETGALIDADTVSARNWFIMIRDEKRFDEFEEKLNEKQ